MRNFIIAAVAILLFWSRAVYGQAPMHVYPQKYTSTAFTVFNVNNACYGSGLKMYINNVEFTNFTYGFCSFGICQFRFPFGNLNVGDVITVKDACGNTSTPSTVVDDYAYVEVAGGQSYNGNGISPNDESLPFSRLNNSISVGKCEPININSHTLHEIKLLLNSNGSPFTSGIYKLNGAPINAGTFNIDNFGNSSSTFTFNANGSITANGRADFYSTQNFSGQVPVSLEYTHNGQSPQHEFFVGPLAVQFLDNFSIIIKEFRYDGSEIQENISGNFSNSKLLFTFNNGVFKLFIDDVERKAIQRTVVYSSSSGTISNGGILPYTTGVSWAPGASGEQWVQAIMDGIRVVRQRFYVQEDMVINQTVTNVACNGQTTGNVNLQVSGGQPGLQYSKDNVSFSSDPNFGGLSANNYTFYVRDASGCQTSKNIGVSENSPISILVSSKSNANCTGQANGSATLAANGGAGFYEYGYSDANYQSNSTISNLVSGSYVFWVKDAAGCKVSIADQIGLNSSLNASISTKQNLLCFNDNTGSVTLSNTGSNSGTVSYSKDGLVFQNTPVFGGLAAGNYTFTLKDNLCTVTVSENLSEPSLLSLTGNIDNQVSCFGGSNAKITVTQNGGTSIYTFSSDDTNYTNSNVFDNLPIGNYKYWVKDQNGCKANTPIFTITQPADITFSVSSKTDISCFGGNDGVVTLAATGGVTTYEYTIDNANYQSSNIFSGLTYGLKTFGIKDQNGCIKTTSTTLLQPTALQLSISQSNNLVCNSDNTGMVTLLGSGGTTPYTYFKDNSVGQSTSAFTGLAAGSYIFSAKDAKNCEVILSSITLTQPTPIQINHILKTDINCETYADGVLGFVASGSNGGFNYTLTGKDFRLNDIGTISAANGQFNNLKAGNYVLTATDQFACTKTYDAAIVPKNSGIRFDLNTTLPSSCLATDGGISVTNIRGGRPNPTYSIKLSGQNIFGSQTTFNNLINGNYIITVADELCSYNQEVSLRLASSLNANYTISPISCISPNANILVDPISGGSGNYQLALNGGAFSANKNFSNLSPNTYGIVIKDSPLTCQTTLSFEIKEQNRADLKTSQVQDISCFEGRDGFIQAIGDNNLSPFTYSFNNLSSFSSNNNFGGLPIGTYRIYAKNSIGCLDSIRVTLNQPTKILWDVNIKNNDCFGDKTGAIAINGTGGTPPYQYAISNTFIDNNNFTQLFAGKYNPAIRDSKGCLFEKEEEVIQPTELKINPVYKDTITCFGERNGAILIEANGGTQGYTFAMGNENVYDVSDTFKNLGVGKYSFFVRDGNQCLKQTELLITEPERLDLNLTSQTDPLCIGEKNGTITLQAQGGNNGGYTYTIDNSLKQFNNGLFNNLSEGDYTFKVEDRKACFDTVTLVKLKWPKALSATLSQKQPVCFGDANGQIFIEASGGVGGFTAEILNKDITFFEKLQNAGSGFTFQKLPAGIYEFAVKDKNGCQLSLVDEIVDAVKIDDFYLPMDTTVCKEQIVKINIDNSSNRIQWFFNDSELTPTNQNLPFGSDLMVSKPGKYKVRISNTTGCEIIKSFELKNSNEALIADFLMTIQAFEGDTVYALDISKPTPDEIIWTLPAEAFKISQNTDGMIFKIDTEGTYTIEMLARKGECQNIKIRELEIFKKEDIDKTSGELFYNEYDIFKSLNVFPNPNYGKFDVEIKLSKTADIEIVITRASNGVLIYKEGFTGKADYTIPIALKNFMQDNYLLTVKVGNVVMVKRILLMN